VLAAIRLGLGLNLLHDRLDRRLVVPRRRDGESPDELRGLRRPGSLVDGVPLGLGQPEREHAERLAVAEGEPDWLLWAARQRETEAQGPACFGIEAGAWAAQIADRIPTGAHVVIRSHHDEPGDRYAQQIAASLRGRCRIFRTSVGEEASR
jgi:hypothetical protein